MALPPRRNDLPADDPAEDILAFSRSMTVRPKLQRLSVRVIAEAMGASISHGSKVRSGLLVSHRCTILATLERTREPDLTETNHAGAT